MSVRCLGRKITVIVRTEEQNSSCLQRNNNIFVWVEMDNSRYLNYKSGVVYKGIQVGRCLGTNTKQVFEEKLKHSLVWGK